jgi:Domain of unknown function (DUF5666)
MNWRCLLIATLGMLVAILPLRSGAAGPNGPQVESSGPNGPQVERPTSIRHGVVSKIDDAAKTFGCHWKEDDWIFRATDQTVFLIGGSKGAWQDLKVGQRIEVESHAQDNDRVADRVTIQVK